MANKIVNLTIKLRDGVTGVLARIRGGIAATGAGFKRLGNFGASVFRGIAKAGLVAFGTLTASAVVLGKTIQASFKFETLRTQIQVLVGSVQEAKRVFDELKEFSASTPFELPGIIDAWQQLKTFTEGALNTRDGLVLVGDAAAARGKDFAEVAFWVGRLYSSLKNGDPILDSVSALQRMGIMGGTIRGELVKMTESGEDFGDMWGVVERQLTRFTGGMSMLSKTGGGLMSTLRDNWTIAVATFGDEFQKAAKGGITDMINTIQRLVKDGTITKWAQQAKGALESVVAAAKIIAGRGPDGARKELFVEIGNLLKYALMVGGEWVADKLRAAFNIERFTGTLKQIPRDLVSWSGGLIKDLAGWGFDFVKNLTGSLLDKAPEIGRKIGDGLKSAFGFGGEKDAKTSITPIDRGMAMVAATRKAKDDAGERPSFGPAQKEYDKALAEAIQRNYDHIIEVLETRIAKPDMTGPMAGVMGGQMASPVTASNTEQAKSAGALKTKTDDLKGKTSDLREETEKATEATREFTKALSEGASEGQKRGKEFAPSEAQQGLRDTGARIGKLLQTSPSAPSGGGLSEGPSAGQQGSVRFNPVVKSQPRSSSMRGLGKRLLGAQDNFRPLGKQDGGAGQPAGMMAPRDNFTPLGKQGQRDFSAGAIGVDFSKVDEGVELSNSQKFLKRKQERQTAKEAEALAKEGKLGEASDLLAGGKDTDDVAGTLKKIEQILDTRLGGVEGG